MRRIAILAVGIGLGLAACASKAPVTLRKPPFPLAVGAVHVDVGRPGYQEQVERGLVEAGVPIASSSVDLMYLLEVDIGGAQGGGSSCGSLRNVRYKLHYTVVNETGAGMPDVAASPRDARIGRNIVVGAQALEIVAKGYDGACDDSVFGTMGRAVRREMTPD
jgi:hypothetical protein